MVFGELLGGLAMRGGQRMHEDLLRQRQTEDWQRQQTLGQWQDFVAKNWDNMDVDQQTATVDQIAPILGRKPKDLYPMITAAKAIHGMIPQIQATRESMGPTQRTGGVTATPSTEAPVTVARGRYAGQSIAAPDTIEIGQVPQPGEIGSPAIMAPTTGGTAYAPSMTPKQVQRQRAIGDIRSSGMDADAQKVAEQALYGVPPSYETGMARIDQQRAAADQRYVMSMQKMNAIYGRPSVIKRGDQELFVWGSGAGAKLMGPDGTPVPYIPDPADTMVTSTGTPPLGSDFRQYIQRMEAERGYPLSAAEVQAERNAFPDSPVQIKTVENGQDVIKVIPRSQLVNRGKRSAGPAAKSAKGGAATPAGPGLTPLPNASGATPPLSPIPNAPAKTPTISPIPNTPRVGGGSLTFPSQQTASEKKLGDEYEMSYDKVNSVETMQSPDFMGAIRGGNLDYTLRAKFPEVAKWFGRPDISPQEATFRAMHESLRNSIINLLSGAAVSPTEGVRIMGELPDPSRPGDWEGRMIKSKYNAAFLLNRIRERQGKPAVPLPQLPGGPTIIDNSRGVESVESPEARKQRLREKYGAR